MVASSKTRFKNMNKLFQTAMCICLATKMTNLMLIISSIWDYYFEQHSWHILYICSLSIMWFKHITKIALLHFNIHLLLDFLDRLNVNNSVLLQILAFLNSYLILFSLTYLMCDLSGLYKKCKFSSLPNSRIAGRTENVELPRSVSYPRTSLFCWG
jgi:hypothetical protein